MANDITKYLDKAYAERQKNASNSSINNYLDNLYRSKRKQNEGGVGGGIGYTLGKLGTGALGILEGATDYTVGGIAKLFGQDEYAEQLFADDKTGSLNAQLDDWYNPSKTMQIVGDVASGIGNSLVGVGVVAGASLLSGGTLTPLAAGLVSGGAIGLGAAGMSTAEAYKKTGQLGAKEFGYGALSGITEAGLEAVSGAAGKVGAKLFAKKTAETVAKSSILKGIAKSFVGEAFEEGMSEFLDPYFQRWTQVDPDAKNATAQEIGYAALIGGISGALLDGVGSSANAIRSTVSGNKIVNSGKTNVVLDTAKEFAKYQEKNNTTNKAYQEIKSMVDEYEALDAKNTSGTPNVRQRRLLGDMQTANTVLAFSPAVEQSKARILANADEFANYLNGLNIKMEDGSVFKTSAEDLRTNEALLTRYAVSDALGHILMDSKSVYDLTMSGDAETVQNKFIGGELAFMRFKEDASDAEIKEISNLLGIDVKNATYEQYIDKLKTTPANVFEDYRDTLASMTNAKRAIGEAKVKKTDVPVLSDKTEISDGISVFKDSNGNYFAIIKEGKTYRIYQDGKLTKELNKKTLNSLLFTANETEKQAKSEAKTDKEVEKTETAREPVEKTAADAYARKNLKGYDELSERQKIAVRWTIMSGKANGVSEDVITAFARISADTKTNIGFADGVADGITYTNDGEHTIYLNANGTRTVEKGVMHELTHAMKGTEGYAELQALAEQYFSTHESEYNEIKERYETFYKKNNLAFTEDILSDELTAHFVEKQMESRKVLTRMTEDDPSFTKKCLDFLQRIKQHFISGTKADADMSNVERKFLSVYNAYKARQQSKISEKRYSLSSMSKDWGATLEEMESGAYKNKEGYKDTVVDLSINLFNNNKKKYKNVIEARRSVETQIDGIVKVAVAMKKAGLDIEVAEGSDARDTKGRSLFSSLEPNSDYVTSHDISTECNKRESFQEIYEAIIAKDPTFFYDIGNYFVIHDIMAKKGLTTPCRDCYVESMRKNLAPMAESFISMLHPNKKLGKSNAAKRDRMIISTGEEEVGAEKDGGYIAKYGLTVDYDVKKKNMPLDTKTLNVRMLTTEDGIATLRTLYPEIYEQFNGYYGQAKPKLPRRSAPYRFGELTAMFTNDNGNIKKSLIDKIKAAGGLRFQSYSDFKLKNTTDVLQVVLEAESLGLTGQAYTKVPAFLEVVGDTNMKINISIFTENTNEAEELKAKPDPKELDWRLDKLESFPMSIDDIYEKYVQADKNGDTTIIDVVQNVSNAAWAMVNDKIGYAIPYHKSGMQMEFKRNKKGQRTAIDHTAYQNEKIGAKRVKENLSFHEYWWDYWEDKQSQLDDIMAKEGKNGVIKAKLTHYFDECAKDGRKPKFYDIYLAKDITDICKAQAEKLGLNLSDSDIYFEYKAKNGETWKVPYGYYKFLGDYQVFKPDGTESMPQPLTLEGYDFDRLASRFSDKESIARTELLQQVTDKENFANKSNEEISSEIKKRRQESAEEALNGKRYALKDGINVDKIKGSDLAMTELPQDRLTLRDVVTDKSKVNAFKSQVSGDAKRFTEGWQIMFTNAQAGLERVIKSAGIKEATAKTNYVRAAKYAGMNAIDEEGGQYTLDGEKRVGDSLVKIWSPIYKGQKLGENYKKNPTKNAKNARYEDYQQKFNLYLLHQHNVDRYAEGKMVLGEDITPEVSEKEIAKMDEAYPEFRAVAEKTWKFTDNLLQLAVDSGMYSQEYVDNLREMYPHYVPTYREEHMNGVRSIFGARDIAVNAAKKRAKGADTRVLPIDDVIARMTVQRYSSSRINKLLVDLADGFDKNKVSSEDFRILSSEDSDLDMDNGQLVDTKKTSGGYQVTFYRNGKRVTAEVSKAVFSGIDAFAPSGDTTFHNVLLDGVAKVNSTFKKLVTSLNPFFSYFRNPLRDIQDAGLYTRYPLRTFAKNYARARKEITGNGAYWQEAKAAGITSASVFDYEKGITTKQKNKVQRLIDRIEATSNTIEMTPRLAEYISARESGKNVQEALLEAQDVTTNFGRGGVFAKKLNSTIMPFLNPAIQGFSKMVRAYTGKDAAQSYVNLIIRSVMLGIGMAALNDIMNDDDEDYQNLSDYVKETNYVLSLGNGEFVKIPKGRVVGVLGEVYLRSKWYLQGDKKAYEGLLKSFSQQVTPVDNFSRTIFSPIMDLKNNKTWYGGAIESQKWENTKPSDRYDESTSSIAIWLGKVFDYSPLKINYLLDQYGGVVTDIVLPATSTQAETGIVTQNMLVNSITNSKWSSKFYDTLEEYNYKKTDGDSVAAGVVKYLNGIRSTISDMNKQISEIQQSDLSDDEKIKQEKIIQAAINALEKDALTNAKYLEEELGKYDMSDDSFDANWRDAVSTTVGEDYALKTYNKDVYGKAKTLSTGGIGMGTYYDYYFDVKNIDSDKKANGEAISGSKKAKVIAYTWQLNIPAVQKLMLIMSSGYTIADDDVKGYNSVSARKAVAQYITQLNISKEEKLALARTCGLNVVGNKIIIKK